MPSIPSVILATPAWSLNGPNVFSANLVRGLRARGIAAHIVITRPDWTDTKPLPRPADIPFETLPAARFLSYRARCRTMRAYLESRAPCIYVPNYDFGHSCVSAQLSNRVAVAGIIHSDDPQHYDHVARLGSYWNAVVAVSTSIREETLRIRPDLAGRICTIPYGIASAAQFPERSGAAGGVLRLVYTGRLDQPQKRVLDLPGIVRAALDRGVPVRLTVVGSGPAETELRARCAALGVASSVTFLSTLGSTELSAVLAGHDVFLLASAFEGLPISMLEAMGQGCVPVVTDIRSGVGELLDDGVQGFRVRAGDFAAFADRLATLQNDSALRRRMAEAAYEKAASGSFRLDRMVDRYVDLFTRMMTTPFRRSPAGLSAPPNLPWQEHLPGLVQRGGHAVRELLRGGEA